ASCWTKPAVVTGAGLRPDQSGKPFGNQDLSRRLSRDNRSVAAHRCDLKQGSGNIHKSTQMSKRIPQDARTAQRTYGGRIYTYDYNGGGYFHINYSFTIALLEDFSIEVALTGT